MHDMRSGCVCCARGTGAKEAAGNNRNYFDNLREQNERWHATYEAKKNHALNGDGRSENVHPELARAIGK
jgi:hypothetical protein